MRRTHAFVLLLGFGFLFALPRIPTDPDQLLRETFRRDLYPQLLSRIQGHGLQAPPLFVFSLSGPGEVQVRKDLQGYLAEKLGTPPPGDGAEIRPLHLSLVWSREGREVDLKGSLRSLRKETFLEERLRLMGWESLLPPLIAILLAFAFRRTLLCLFAGIWVGAAIYLGGNPFKGLIWVGYEGILRHSLMDQFRLEILVFIFGLVGAVGIMSRMGGVTGMLDLVRGAVRGARSTQVFTVLMGFVIFFDDYANTILVGTTMRPLTDRWRVSRERLAYLVDSTAAPVAGISALSTWVAYEMSLYADQLPAAGIEQDAYIIFLRTIPYRFYSLFTLALVLLSAASGRSFGPMLRAERRARQGQVSPELSGPRGRAERLTDRALRRTQMKAGLPARWWNAALPLGLVILLTVVLLLHYGNIDGRSLGALFELDYLRGTVLSNTQSARALAWAALAGFMLALLLARGQKLLSWREGLAAGSGNFRAMFEAVGILILAWVMGYICELLGTSQVLIAMASGRLESMALLLPVFLFLTGAAVSFSTGSSWSTMAILLPNVVLLASRLGETTALGAEGMLLVSIGAVLEGSIFGDHCSPISDTTILSSVASSCPHMAHVKTQIPYALAGLAAALLAGYLPVMLGLPVLWSFALGIPLLAVLVFTVGRPAEPVAGQVAAAGEPGQPGDFDGAA